MTEDQRAVQLRQLANIVIDAYINRDERFVPEFGKGRAIFYPSRPEDGDPKLQPGYWYERGDFEGEER